MLLAVALAQLFFLDLTFDGAAFVFQQAGLAGYRHVLLTTFVQAAINEKPVCALGIFLCLHARRLGLALLAFGLQGSRLVETRLPVLLQGRIDSLVGQGGRRQTSQADQAGSQ